jgi:hypothetical protein
MSQNNWRWCHKCSGMFHGAPNPSGRCPAGGQHDPVPSGDYEFEMDNPSAPGQHGWRYCGRCAGMTYGFGEVGVCPASGSHSTFNSSDYAIVHGADSDPPLVEGQQGWRWCEKCSGLYFGGSTSVCPAGGSHGTVVSGHYAVRHKALITTKPVLGSGIPRPE